MPALDWIGKKAVVNHHKEVPFHLLRCDEKLSVGDPGSGNLLVQGDNLIALKALLPYYAGQVKCVYIDPPYNTGNENWAYNDNVSSPEIKEWLGKAVGGELDDLTRHDKWLCMIYPRLFLLREMLRDDGAIFISIDETEVSYLRILMDDIFGRQNFVECITWNKRIPKNDAGIGNIHEYVMIYRKSSSWNYEFTMKKEGLEKVFTLVDKLKKNKTPLPEAEEALRKLYKDQKYERGITLYNSLDENYRPWGKINMSWPNANTFGPRYEVRHPLTKKPVKIPERGWRWKEDTFKEKLGDGQPKKLHDGTFIVGQIWFDKDEKIQPSSVNYLHEMNRILLRSILSMKSDGGIELEEIFGEKAKFAYPKPTSLLQVIIDSLKIVDGDIFFDSFAGSGTTGHAILKQNMEDGINRKFVLIEMEENICQNITRERLKFVIGGLNNKNSQRHGIDGFRYCILDKPLFDKTGQIRSEVKFNELAAHVYFCETGEPLPKRTNGRTPLLGIHNGIAIYLLYNGILGDKTPDGGNILTRTVLNELPKHNSPKVIYGTSCRIGSERLKKNGIVFRQIPYEVRII